MDGDYDSMADMRELLWPSVAFIFVTAAALTLRLLLLSPLRRWVRSPIGVEFLDAVRMPSVLWCIVLGLYVGIDLAGDVSDLPPRIGRHVHSALTAAIILSVTMTVAGVIGTVIGSAGERLGGAVTGLAQTSARGLILMVGMLVLLSSVGIQITPVLTALGVGGLAVALALQDTLSNLFAGVHLLADRPIRVGDYVKIADNVEGYVVDVGWRSTRVRMLQNNVVIVPNKRVAESVIVNYDM